MSGHYFCNQKCDFRSNNIVNILKSPKVLGINSGNRTAHRLIKEQTPNKAPRTSKIGFLTMAENPRVIYSASRKGKGGLPGAGQQAQDVAGGYQALTGISG